MPTLQSHISMSNSRRPQAVQSRLEKLLKPAASMLSTCLSLHVCSAHGADAFHVQMCHQQIFTFNGSETRPFFQVKEISVSAEQISTVDCTESLAAA